MDTIRAMTLLDTTAPAATRAQAMVEFATPSHPKSISRIRARVRRFARSLGFTSGELDDICIAVGEAATNAMKHGGSLEHPTIGIRMERDSDALRVLISDGGRGFDPAKVCPPGIDDLSECGRGIMCMCALMDEVRFNALNPGTRVEMVKYAS